MDKPRFLELQPFFGGKVVEFVFHMIMEFALCGGLTLSASRRGRPQTKRVYLDKFALRLCASKSIRHSAHYSPDAFWEREDYGNGVLVGKT